MSILARTHVYLDGSIVLASRARISVFDRGLLYGDGLFETVRSYRGRPLALREHLARLRMSARFLGIPFPGRPWARDIDRLLRRNRLTETDAWVRITLTRGPAAPGLLPPRRPEPTVLVIAGRLDPTIATVQQEGARVVLLPFSRYGFLAEHKILDYLPGILGKVIAAHRLAFEALYVDPDGFVTEGTTSNLFVIRRGRLTTPPLPGLLPGVTRRFLIDLARADGMSVIERPLTRLDLRKADEVLITSSLAEVVPVVTIDEQPVKDGRVGPLARKLQALYRQLVDKTLRHAKGS
jgi:branched-chain amino acid aminotransferase